MIFFDFSRRDHCLWLFHYNFCMKIFADTSFISLVFTIYAWLLTCFLKLKGFFTITAWKSPMFIRNYFLILVRKFFFTWFLFMSSNMLFGTEVFITIIALKTLHFHLKHFLRPDLTPWHDFFLFLLMCVFLSQFLHWNRNLPFSLVNVTSFWFNEFAFSWSLFKSSCLNF